jgi:hypothetical protein
VRPGASFVLDVWAHLDAQRGEVVRRAIAAATEGRITVRSKGPIHVEQGTLLTLTLSLDELTVADPVDTIAWTGEIGSATFAVSVGQGVSEGQKLGLVRVSAGGLEIAKLNFVVEVGKGGEPIQGLPVRQLRHRKAFASYASADRDKVMARIQGMQKVEPTLEVFLDVVSLRSGQMWERELFTVIPAHDVFYLFWSEQARASEWVEKEWRCALRTRGLEFIDPVPLVSPREVPPPPELASRHFGDWHLAFLSGTE